MSQENVITHRKVSSEVKEKLVESDVNDKGVNVKRKTQPLLNPGIIFMTLLALQVGTQPIIARKCVR